MLAASSQPVSSRPFSFCRRRGQRSICNSYYCGSDRFSQSLPAFMSHRLVYLAPDTRYVEPAVGILTIHIWAVVVWLPLITMLGAERSLWVSCIVPLGLCQCRDVPQPLEQNFRRTMNPSLRSPMFSCNPPSTTPLWRALLPYWHHGFHLQSGLMFAAHWPSLVRYRASFRSVMLFLLRHPFVHGKAKSRRKFSRFSLLQTAAVFSSSQRHSRRTFKGVWPAFSGFLFPVPTAHVRPVSSPRWAPTFRRHPHASCKASPAHRAPTTSDATKLFQCLAKPVIIPFDGVYCTSTTRKLARQKTHTFSKATPSKQCALDGLPATSMEAHQTLLTPISATAAGRCASKLLNGDDPPRYNPR